MRRSRFISSFAATTAGAALGGTAEAQVPPVVSVASLINDTGTSALYAVQAGLFRRAGLNVQLQNLPSGGAAAAAVAGGASQFGLSSLVTLIQAFDRGAPFTLVAPAGVVSSEVPYSQFVVRTDAPITSARDLNGKTIGSPSLKDLDTLAIMNWVDEHGGDSKTLRFLEIGGQLALTALEEDRIDGVELNTPTLTLGIDSGKVRVLAQIFDAIAPRFSNTAWFSTQAYTLQHPDVVDKFAHAMNQSAVFCNAHHADTIPLVAENAKLDKALVARMARVTFGDYLRTEEIQPLIDVAYKYKLISKRIDAHDLISPDALRPTKSLPLL